MWVPVMLFALLWMAGPVWKQAGIDVFMTKPVNVHELHNRLMGLHKDMLRSKSAASLLSTGTTGLKVSLTLHK